MTKHQKWQSKRMRPQRKKGIARPIDWLKNMNWRGKAIIFSGAAIVIAAIVVAIVLISGANTQAEQASVAVVPEPTTAATPLPTPTPTPLPTTPPEPTIDPTLQQGDENERVMELQGRLMDLGYLDLDELTNYYGPATEYAVFLFQRQHGLQQDGIAGWETQKQLYSDDASIYLLLQGTEGNDVDALQRQLMDLGYLGKATGYYGTQTIAAVEAFQERNDLDVDGLTGPNTLELIYSPNAEPTAEKKKEKYAEIKIDKMIEVAKEQLGKPYVWGAQGPNSFDCSGFVYYCLRAAGSDRNRYNAKGYSEVDEWDRIDDTDDLKPGDLLFFWSSARHKIGHVGIYLGDNKMIDASQSNNAIMIRDYRWSNYKWAMRPWG